MTSREIIRAALNHEQPERVPIDFGGNLFEVPQFLYRIDNYLMHMGLYPEACERLSEALCNFYMPRMERWLGGRTF